MRCQPIRSVIEGPYVHAQNDWEQEPVILLDLFEHVLQAGISAINHRG